MHCLRRGDAKAAKMVCREYSEVCGDDPSFSALMRIIESIIEENAHAGTSLDALERTITTFLNGCADTSGSRGMWFVTGVAQAA